MYICLLYNREKISNRLLKRIQSLTNHQRKLQLNQKKIVKITRTKRKMRILKMKNWILILILMRHLLFTKKL